MATVVMTGGTAGLGEVAAKKLAAKPSTHLLLGARTPAADTVALDLRRLDSVREFADAIGQRLGPTLIDVLILNAGVSFADDEHRTADGFETTFAVNHLAHYLLLRLLLPRLADHARVVITTSSVHDPEKPTALPVPAPRHADARLLASPESDPERDTNPRTAGQRAYASSKLCNVLTARGLAQQARLAGKSWQVVAYDPGPTPGTGLSRNMNPLLRGLWWVMGSPVRYLIPTLSSRTLAGETLASLATDEPIGGSGYASLVRKKLTWPEPSTRALRDGVRDKLWRDSADLVGLSAG